MDATEDMLLWSELPQTSEAARRGRSFGRDRTHGTEPRQRRLNVRFTAREMDAVQEAALAAGLTPTGYVAGSAVATATQSAEITGEPLRVALRELMQARNQLRLLCEALPRAFPALDASAYNRSSEPARPQIELSQAIRRAHSVMRHLNDAAARVVRAVR